MKEGKKKEKERKAPWAIECLLALAAYQRDRIKRNEEEKKKRKKRGEEFAKDHAKEFLGLPITTLVE